MFLVVTRAFGPHVRGDAITDPAVIAAVLASEDAPHVVAVEPEPAPELVKE